MNIDLVNQYFKERAKWNKFGKPLRSEEERHILFEICNNCINFQKKDSNTGTCSICGCNIKKDGNFLNKIAWGTTRCPLDPPKWKENKEEYEENIIIQPQEIEVAKKEYGIEKEVSKANDNPSPKGCGCGK